MGDRDLDDARLKADQQLVEFLESHGFTGPLYREFANDMAAYGIAVLTAWLRSRLIFVKCANSGIVLPSPPPEWSAEEQLELTLETVARALYSLRCNLIEGKWNSSRGASLKTYFIQGCIYKFPDPYRAWLRSLHRRPEIFEEANELLIDETRGPEDIAVDRDEARRALCEISSPTVRAAMALASEGYSHEEIADLIGEGATARSVEGALYRYRRRVQGGGRS